MENIDHEIVIKKIKRAHRSKEKFHLSSGRWRNAPCLYRLLNLFGESTDRTFEWNGLISF